MKFNALVIACLTTAPTQLLAGAFPDKVESVCDIEWMKTSGVPFLKGSSSVLIDLKDAKGGLQEKAWIFLECKGAVGKSPKGLPTIVGTECAGVRMNGLNKDKLSSNNAFAITPSDIEIMSDQSSKAIKMTWQGESRFTIIPGKSFSWSMTSKMSGDHHQGSTECRSPNSSFNK